MLIDSSFSDTVKNYRMEELENLKASINVEYDATGKVYTIEPHKLHIPILDGNIVPAWKTVATDTIGHRISSY